MQPFYRLTSWIPLIAGTVLIFLHSDRPYFWLAFLPTLILLVGGVRMLLSPDLRAPQHVALGSLLGIIVSIPLGLLESLTSAIIMIGLSVAAFIASGWYQILMQPKISHVPAPPPSVKYAVEVAIDNLLLGFFSFMTPIPSPAELEEAIAETQQTLKIANETGWLDNPLDYHQQPGVPDIISTGEKVLHKISCETFEFDSNYAPAIELPGYQRWQGYEANRRCYATLLRQENVQAPWMICLHGFGMGNAKNDLSMLQADRFYNQGLNVALFTLPVHGERAPGKFSGSAFMGISPLDYLHAETQAIWDLRQLINWIRVQGGNQIGVYGISLGAYTASLLASIENGLSCVIVGVPAIGVIPNRELLASNIERRIPAAAGLCVEDELKIHSLVSPLHLHPRVDLEHRYMFAGTGDQLVAPEHVKKLWEHWEKPEIAWCRGAHASSMKHEEARLLVERAISESFGI